MNLYYHALTHLPLGKSRARSNNLLALAPHPLTDQADQDRALARLAGLGYIVTRPAARHWVLTKAGESFQVHLYSEQELAAFATDRAALYACGFALPAGETS